MYNTTPLKLSVVRDGFEPSTFHSVVDELASAPTYEFLGVAEDGFEPPTFRL